MCWCSRIKPCLGVTGALCLVFLPPRSYRFTVGRSYDLLFLCVPWVGYITYFHWPALFFSCAHTHTHSALTYFFWIIQLEIREALGQTLPCLDCICGGLDFILFSLVSCTCSIKLANLSTSASILKHVSLMHNSVKNELLRTKTKVGAKKNKQKKIESSIYSTVRHWWGP